MWTYLYSLSNLLSISLFCRSLFCLLAIIFTFSTNRDSSNRFCSSLRKRFASYSPIHTYIHTHTYMQTYIHAYIHTCIHIHTYCTYVHTCIYMYIDTYICITYIDTYIYIHRYINTYIHTHTYIHTWNKTHFIPFLPKQAAEPSRSLYAPFPFAAVAQAPGYHVCMQNRYRCMYTWMVEDPLGYWLD